MCIIHLDGCFFRELLPVIVSISLESSENILERTGDKEILLLQSQLFSHIQCIIWIKNLRKSLSINLFSYCFCIISGVKFLERESVWACCRPKSESVYCLSAISDDRSIISDAVYLFGRNPLKYVFPIFSDMGYVTAEINRVGEVWSL